VLDQLHSLKVLLKFLSDRSPGMMEVVIVVDFTR